MAEMKAPAARPLSPHLQIYRWSWTMAMSILHRATGLALYAGTVLIAAWLIAAASGPAGFAWAQWAVGSPPGLLILFGYSFALFLHMVGGLRHFVWDMGVGYEPAMRMNMARLSPFVAGALTLIAWAVGLALR
jgi:succinate dehydrogenase / fumarate reductase cytochrome b subunit